MLHAIEEVTEIIRESGIRADARARKNTIVVTCPTWDDATHLDTLFSRNGLPSDRIITRRK